MGTPPSFSINLLSELYAVYLARPRADYNHVVECGRRSLKVAFKLELVQCFACACIEQVHISGGVACYDITVAIVVVHNDGR